MTRVQIQPEVLEWAAYHSGLPLSDFATRLSVRDADKIMAGSLSEAQVRRASKLAKVKFHELFRETPPPAQAVPLADFRTLPHKKPLSKDFFDVYNDVLYKQEWYKDFLLKEGAEPLPFIGLYKNTTNYKKIAAELRRILSISAKPATNDFNAYYAFLAQKTEELGILVFKNGIVGNNTHRPLNVSEFRGFTISDPIAPVIFINGKDAPPAWIFTLVHELAHLLRGESAISDASSSSTKQEEILCNRIAAEALAPESEFISLWNEHSNASTEDRLSKAQIAFNVSAIVIARRAFDLGLISHRLYAEKKRESKVKKTRNGSSGGNFYASLNLRNSKTLTKTVCNLAASGALSFKEAGRLLQVSPTSIMKIHQKNNAISS